MANVDLTLADLSFVVLDRQLPGTDAFFKSISPILRELIVVNTCTIEGCSSHDKMSVSLDKTASHLHRHFADESLEKCHLLAVVLWLEKHSFRAEHHLIAKVVSGHSMIQVHAHTEDGIRLWRKVTNPKSQNEHNMHIALAFGYGGYILRGSKDWKFLIEPNFHVPPPNQQNYEQLGLQQQPPQQPQQPPQPPQQQQEQQQEQQQRLVQRPYLQQQQQEQQQQLAQ
ncbi:hypothetical protein HK100_005628, partial [Physocladia obscura]